MSKSYRLRPSDQIFWRVRRIPAAHRLDSHPRSQSRCPQAAEFHVCSNCGGVV